MNAVDVMERVCQVLVNEFELDAAAVTPEANLYEDLGLDSLDSVDLVVALEKAFDFKITRSEDEPKIRAIRTVEDICQFIHEKVESSRNA